MAELGMRSPGGMPGGPRGGRVIPGLVCCMIMAKAMALGEDAGGTVDSWFCTELASLDSAV